MDSRRSQTIPLLFGLSNFLRLQQHDGNKSSSSSSSLSITSYFICLVSHHETDICNCKSCVRIDQSDSDSECHPKNIDICNCATNLERSTLKTSSPPIQKFLPIIPSWHCFGRFDVSFIWCCETAFSLKIISQKQSDIS